MSYVLTLYVEDYDDDFGFIFKGKEVRENQSLCVMGESEHGAWKNLADNLSYAHNFFSDPSENPTDGWALWAKRIIHEFPKLISGELDVTRDDTYTHAYYANDDDGKTAKVWGNRVFEINVKPFHSFDELNGDLKYEMLEQKDLRLKEFIEKFNNKSLRQLNAQELMEWYNMIK